MAHPEIEEWLATAVGVAMNPDGHYGLQCVDLADQYAQDIFGVSWSESIGGVQGAKQILDAASDKYWTRIDNNGDPNQIPQRGDVIVWGGNSVNQWGHVAVVEDADTNGVDVIQQDGFAAPLIWADGNWYSNKPAHRAHLGYTNPGTGLVLGWLRPKLATAAPAPAPTAPAPAADAPMQPFQRQLGADAGAYRKGASRNAELIDWFVPGSVYDFKGFVRGESVDGNNIWFVGAHTGGFAWSGAFTSQSTASLADMTPDAKPIEIAAPNERTVGKVVANLRTGAGTNFGLLKLPDNGVPDGQLKIDTTYVFKGFVHGEKVGSSDIWLVSRSNGYAHIGAFTNESTDGLPDLTPASAPAPSTPATPAPSAPALGYSFTKDLSCVTEVKPAGIGHFKADGLPKRPLKIVIHQFDAADKAVPIDSVIGWFQSPNNDKWTSAHFAVQGSRIVQVVKLGDRAYHAGAGGNDYIGIETYVAPGGNPADTFASVVKLILELQTHYGYKLDLIDHRSVSSTSCGADINIPAYKAAVAAATAPVIPTPAPVVPVPHVPDELELFAAAMHAQIDAYVASRKK